MTADALARLLDEARLAPTHNPSDPAVRRLVWLRGRQACEYCLMPVTSDFQLDHIVPPKRWRDVSATNAATEPDAVTGRGPQHIDNFACACATCNRAKADKLTEMVRDVPIRLFNPRQDVWPEHFRFLDTYLYIVGLTHVGRATLLALELNLPVSRLRRSSPLALAELRPDRLADRHTAILLGRYPPEWARAWRFD